jgi:hypothetical protein
MCIDGYVSVCVAVCRAVKPSELVIYSGFNYLYCNSYLLCNLFEILLAQQALPSKN